MRLFFLPLKKWIETFNYDLSTASSKQKVDRLQAIQRTQWKCELCFYRIVLISHSNNGFDCFVDSKPIVNRGFVHANNNIKAKMHNKYLNPTETRYIWRISLHGTAAAKGYNANESEKAKQTVHAPNQFKFSVNCAQSGMEFVEIIYACALLRNHLQYVSRISGVKYK